MARFDADLIVVVGLRTTQMALVRVESIHNNSKVPNEIEFFDLEKYILDTWDYADLSVSEKRGLIPREPGIYRVTFGFRVTEDPDDADERVIRAERIGELHSIGR